MDWHFWYQRSVQMPVQPTPTLVPPPGYAPGQTRAPIILGFIYPLFILPVILGLMRFYVRYSIHSIGIDDWLLFFAILSSIAHCVTGLWAVSKGLGRHDYDLIREGRNPLDLVPVCTSRSQHKVVNAEYPDSSAT